MARLAVSFTILLVAAGNATTPDVSTFSNVGVGANHADANRQAEIDQFLLNVQRIAAASNAANAPDIVRGSDVTAGAIQTDAKKHGKNDESLLSVKHLGAAASSAINSPGVRAGSYVKLGAIQMGANKQGKNDESVLNVKHMSAAASNDAPDISVSANQTGVNKQGKNAESLLNVKHIGAAASNATDDPAISVSANQTGANKQGKKEESPLNVKHMGAAASNASNATDISKGRNVTVGANHTDANKRGKNLLKVKRMGTVTILHVSDTHSLHYQAGDLPSADIFIHSGDVAQSGTDGEFGDFNYWLSTIKWKFKHMFVISGNHDFWDTNRRLNQGALSTGEAFNPSYFQYKITNAKVLNHEMVQVMGLKIWGEGWHPQRADSNPGNNYQDLPYGLDILVTHEAPFGIFDQTGMGNWGSSHDLLQAIWEKRPKVHLFGHVHEQRGHWDKTASGNYRGGSEYRPNLWVPQVFRPNMPPPPSYPVEVESNNAMANQPAVDNSWGSGWSAQHLVAGPRLITAKRFADAWHFWSSLPTWTK
ncbi:unnamed protein product [Effrenium voratum]|nr:unnamed protein product [Effrenium voratum]